MGEFMKNKMASFLNMKKICCSIACFSLLFTTSCTALGLPEKDPAGQPPLDKCQVRYHLLNRDIKEYFHEKSNYFYRSVGGFAP